METEKIVIPITIDLDKWKESLDTAVGNASQAVDDISIDFEGIGSGLLSIGGVLVGAMTTMLAAVGGLLVGVGNTIKGILTDSSELAGNLVDLSTKTGFSTTTLQELKFIGDATGVSLDTISQSTDRLTKSMSEGSDAFAILGVNILDANGNYKKSEDVFFEVTAALNGVENETLRNSLAMDLFGKSATDLNGIITASGEELEILREQAYLFGAVVSETDIASLETWGDELGKIENSFEGLKAKFATAFLPIGTAVTDEILKHFSVINTIIEESGGDIPTILSGILEYISEVLLSYAERLPELLGDAFNFIERIASILLENLPILLPIITQILNTLVNFFIQVLPALLEVGVQILLTIVDAILFNLPMLIEAGMQIIIQLMNTLTEAMPTLIPTIIEVMLLIVDILLENLPMLVEASLQLILAIVQGIVENLPTLKNAVPQIIEVLVDTIIELLPIILSLGGEIIAHLIAGMGLLLVSLIDYGEDIIGAITQGLEDGFGGITEAGKNLIEGLWDGIEAKAIWLRNNITAFGAEVIGDFKDVFGIQSPSKVMMGIGGYMAEGLEEGFSTGVDSLDKRLEKSLDKLQGIRQEVTINNFNQSQTIDISRLMEFTLARSS